MTVTARTAKATQLVEQLQAASDAYYNTGTPIMTDVAFDALVEELRATDPNNDWLKTVGAPPSKLFARVRHKIPMGSLLKVQGDELDKWFEKLPSAEVIVQWKFDGASVSLRYERGRLVQAASRGDGTVGEDVTDNIKRSRHVPMTLPTPFTGYVRGEAILYKADFAAHFKGMANPRNAGNGALRSKDGAGCEHLRVLPFDVIGADARTEVAKLKFLQTLGFPIFLNSTLRSADGVKKVYAAMVEARDEQPFEVDGVVIKVNDVCASNSLGYTHGCPKAQRAYKFAALGAMTVVTGITWSIGHTGSIVPTLSLVPVQVGGVTISSVLMNNMGYLEAMDVAVGDTVRIQRAGDVIPHVEGVEERPATRTYARPALCPACQAELVVEGTHLLCKNARCEGRLIRKVRRWLDALDIKFVGPEVEQALWDAGLVKSPADLYTLSAKAKQLADLTVGAGRLGEARAKQILTEVDKTRRLPLHMFMGSLGIQFLGTRAAKNFVTDFGVDTLEKFTDRDFISNATSIGPVVRQAVAEGVTANLPLIAQLLKHIEIEPYAKRETQVAEPTGGKLQGYVMCFTGAIQKTDADGKRYTRAQMWEVVKQHGGAVSEDVRDGVTHLVQADPDSQSSKTRKASKLNVKVVSEAEFWSMLS
jgi:DNA ligase (NAD+)